MVCRDPLTGHEWGLLERTCGTAATRSLREALHTDPSPIADVPDEIRAALASELSAQLDDDERMSSLGLELEEIWVKLEQFLWDQRG